VRESFPSHGSSLSKISLCRGDPAIKFMSVSIVEPQVYPSPAANARGFSNRIGSPDETAPLLKILRQFRVVGVGGGPDLDVAFDHRLRDLIEFKHPWFTLPGPNPDGERPRPSAEKYRRLIQPRDLFGCSRPNQRQIIRST